MECGDDDLRKVTTLGDLGLEPEDKTIKAYREEKDPNKKITDADVVGYYLSKYFSPPVKPDVYDTETAVLVPYDKPETFAMSNPCQRIGGFYSEDANMIMLCRPKFTQKSLQQAIEDQASITEGPDMDKILDQQETPGAVLLHEAIHWSSQTSEGVVSPGTWKAEN